MEEVLDILNKIKFPKNKNRKNVSNEILECFALGLVPYRGQYFCDYKTSGVSRFNKKYSLLYDKLRDLIKNYDSSFNYTTIQVNKNIVCNPHTDKNNIGLSYIIGLGDYEDGNLMIEEDEYDIKNKFILFDGKKIHYNKSFTGDRYSIIYFTHSLNKSLNQV